MFSTISRNQFLARDSWELIFLEVACVSTVAMNRGLSKNLLLKSNRL